MTLDYWVTFLNNNPHHHTFLTGIKILERAEILSDNTFTVERHRSAFCKVRRTHGGMVIAFLLLITLLTSCSSARFFEQKTSQVAVQQTMTDTQLPDLSTITSNKLHAYCLSLPDSTDVHLMLRVHCSQALLSRDDLDEQLRSYAISTYNQALYTLAATKQERTDSKIKVTLSYFTPTSYTFSDEMIAIDTRLQAKSSGEIGIPVVIRKENRKIGLDAYSPVEGILQDATMVMTKLEQQGDTFQITLDILPNNEVSTLKIGYKTYSLKHSPASAYLALIEQANIDDFNWLGFVSPSEAEKRRGVFAIGGISQEKIPLIMIHGLNSDPLIWRHLTMAVLNDPVLMSHYQIWHIYYPSGPPPFYTASRTRDNLNKLLQEVNKPELSDKAVIIGHSMGGVITKLLATNSDFNLWDTTFNIRPESLLTAEDATIKDIFIFEPVFKKSTLFFLDTPFKGSEVANSTIGYIGSFLVTLPSEFTNTFKNLFERVGSQIITKQMRPFLIDYGPNSVQVLRPGHPLMDTLYDIPIAGEAYAIIGSDGELQCEDATSCSSISDGVVSYDSANYRDAKEHIIVPSSHDSFQSKEAIEFILSKLKYDIQ